MHTPEETPGVMDIGVWYLTNDKWRFDGKEYEGSALILMRGAGGPGELYNNVQITVDDHSRNDTTSTFAYLPKS